jgi:putative ABC transport system ATP-binding protein
MIELVQVTKTFNAGRPNQFTALKGIDLTLDSHGITVIKGPSGSGKTTVLSLVGCMARPTSGRIWVDGREVTSLPERFLAKIRRFTFGFVFQNYHLIRGMTVLENVIIPALPTGIAHRAVRRKAMGLLERLGILDKWNQKVEHLSGGEQQRTVMARALINDPSVVIADEPTAHLDSDLSREFMVMISELKGDDKTVVVASHDPLVFQSPQVDRVVSLRDGRICENGGPLP